MTIETTYRCVACKARERWSEQKTESHLCSKCRMPMVLESAKVTESGVIGRLSPAPRSR